MYKLWYEKGDNPSKKEGKKGFVGTSRNEHGNTERKKTRRNAQPRSVFTSSDPDAEK